MLYIKESTIVCLSIVIMILFGYADRYLAWANNLVDAYMFIMAIMSLILIIKQIYCVNRQQLTILLVIAMFTIACIISYLNNFGITGIMQYVLYIAYLAPLLIVSRVSAGTAFKIWLIMILLGVVQLPFDLLFPRSDVDPIDSYTGTFVLANNKSRYLFMLAIAAIFLFRYINKRYRIVMLISVMSMLCSLVLGYSLFVYLFGFASIILGKFYDRRGFALILSILTIAVISFVFIAYAELPIVYFTFNRYIDVDHGVFAVVKYALGLLSNSYFMGTGLGEFVSRSSQSLGGLYVDTIPRTMITFGTIYENTVAPGGLPSYISIITEAGVFGVIASILIIYYLYSCCYSSYLGFSLFIFIFLLSMYMPMFFEGPDGAIFVYAYVIINKAIPYVTELANIDTVQSEDIDEGRCKCDLA